MSKTVVVIGLRDLEDANLVENRQTVSSYTRTYAHMHTRPLHRRAVHSDVRSGPFRAADLDDRKKLMFPVDCTHAESATYHTHARQVLTHTVGSTGKCLQLPPPTRCPSEVRNHLRAGTIPTSGNGKHNRALNLMQSTLFGG